MRAFIHSSTSSATKAILPAETFTGFGNVPARHNRQTVHRERLTSFSTSFGVMNCREDSSPARLRPGAASRATAVPRRGEGTRALEGG